MLPGYNHNVCYKGQIFHIQTEDSGKGHPHIITLLFVKGNIIGRKKKAYDDILNHAKVDDTVRELMQDQHKSMLRDLKNGLYDRYLAPGQADATCPAPAAAGKPAAPAKAAPPPPPPPPAPMAPDDEVIQEKAAEKTINLREDEDLKDEDIFGADLISDKSLDEVILSFLSKQIDED